MANEHSALAFLFGLRLDLFCPSGAKMHGLTRTEATPALYSVIKTGTRIQNTAASNTRYVSI